MRPLKNHSSLQFNTSSLQFNTKALCCLFFTPRHLKHRCYLLTAMRTHRHDWCTQDGFLRSPDKMLTTPQMEICHALSWEHCSSEAVRDRDTTVIWYSIYYKRDLSKSHLKFFPSSLILYFTKLGSQTHKLQISPGKLRNSPSCGSPWSVLKYLYLAKSYRDKPHWFWAPTALSQGLVQLPLPSHLVLPSSSLLFSGSEEPKTHKSYWE